MSLRSTHLGLVILLCSILMAVCGYVSIADAANAVGCSATQNAGFVPLTCYPASSKLANLYSVQHDGDLSDFLNRLFFFSISLGGILAVARLVWAGYEYMASDLWTSKAKAREIIKDTLLGAVLLIAVYLILSQINPDLLNLEIKIRNGGAPVVQALHTLV